MNEPISPAWEKLRQENEELRAELASLRLQSTSHPSISPDGISPDRTLLECINEGIALLDPRGIILCCNRRLSIFVMDSEPIVGRKVSDLFPGKAIEIEELFERVLSGNESSLELRIEAEQKRWLRLWMCSVSGFSPNTICLVISDLTAQRNLEEQLRLTTDRFQLALQGSQVIIFNQNLELRYTWVHNPSLGDKQIDVIGKTDREIFERLEDAEVLEALKLNVIQTGRSRREEIKIRDSGTDHYFDLKLAPLRSEGGRIIGVAGAAIEITERKQAQDIVLRAEEALRRAEKLAVAERLAGVIAHEVNNPLTSVSNLLYLIENKLEPPESGYLAMAQRELTRATQAVMRTLQFHRQQSSPKLVDIEKMLETVLSSYESRMRGAKIRCHRQYRSVRPLNCWESDLRQALSAVLANAVDSMRGTGGELTVRMYERTGAGGNGGIGITVADTGLGMTREVLKRAGEPFYSTKGITGTGLGLWVCQNVLHRHAGAIRIRSRSEGVPCGTVVRIFLPYDREHAQRSR